MRSLLFAGIAVALLAGSAHAGTFYDLNTPSAQLTGLSRNGRVAGLYTNAAAYRWAKDRGVSEIANFNSVNGMDSWGQPLAGAAFDTNGNRVAAVAYSNADLLDGPIVIGPWAGGMAQDNFLSTAYDVSDDGVAVGLAIDENQKYFAFRWSAAEGMTKLTVNRPAKPSRANAISADGSTIVGWNDQDDGARTAVIWKNGVPLDLVDDAGNPVGEAAAVSSDGRVVVGESYATANGSEAWRWTEETGVRPIGCLSDGIQCGPAYAFGLSDDGNVILGASGMGFDRKATIWTPTGGVQWLSDYLTTQDVVVPEGWELMSGGGVSADGKTLSGWGLSPTMLTSFVIDLHDATPTEAIVEAHGTVNWNDLPSGPFAGVAVDTPVTMTFRVTTVDALEVEPGQHTAYPIALDSFHIDAAGAGDTLLPAEFGPTLRIANDYPLSDGIHLFETAMGTEGQTMEFEMFGTADTPLAGSMFDSDDLDRINRTFGPEFFNKTSWVISQQGGSFGMYMTLDSVSINDYGAEPTYTIGGTVSGLEGSGLVLQQSGGDDLAVSAGGAFTFASAVADASAYAVTVLTQPTNPAQTCTVANGSGTVAGANVDDVAVTCVTDDTDTIFADGFEQR